MLHIDGRGHEVGVHIHPDHMTDKKRKFLYEYSYDEQYEMIEKCTRFYEETLNRKPRAFRAGKYGADYKTLDILAEMGYKFDFSNFYGQKWCGIVPPLTKQTPCIYKTIMEVPVFSYKSFRFLTYERFDKLDVENSFMEYKCVLDNIEHKKFSDIEKECIVVMFAHSFSFLKWRRTPNLPKYNVVMADRFDRMMSHAYRKDKISFMSLDELEKKGNDIRHFNLNSDYENIFDMTKIGGLKVKSYLFFFLRAIKVLKMRMEEKLSQE